MTAFVYPYTAAFFMDTLGIEAVEWDIIRFDEFDSQGTGLDMQSEMADPKWTATLVMRELYNAEARAIAAKVRKLDGSALTFLVYDPSNAYPAADPGGRILDGTDWLFASGSWNDDNQWFDSLALSATSAASGTVKLASIGSNNQSVSLSGLPAGYVLTIGDKLQINFGTDSVYFFEVSETVTANGSGTTAAFEVFPHIAAGVAVNATVILKKAACKMTIQPGGFSPGRSQGVITSGTSISAMEHI